MADFSVSVKKTLIHEGGFVNDPADPGGATKYGITQADLPEVQISSLSEQQATDYYREHYWKPLYNEIVSQPVASKIFDAGVNIGIGSAIKLLQRTLHLPEDGVFGPNTLAAVNNAGDTLLAPYKAVLVAHYEAIAAAHPEESKFLAGWISRANS